LLTRHWRITHHAGDISITTEPASSEITASGAHQPEETSYKPAIASDGLHAPCAGSASEHLVSQVNASQVGLHAPAAAFQDAQANIITEGKPHLVLVVTLLE
jgi:hypothetical protein